MGLDIMQRLCFALGGWLWGGSAANLGWRFRARFSRSWQHPKIDQPEHLKMDQKAKDSWWIMDAVGLTAEEFQPQRLAVFQHLAMNVARYSFFWERGLQPACKRWTASTWRPTSAPQTKVCAPRPSPQGRCLSSKRSRLIEALGRFPKRPWLEVGKIHHLGFGNGGWIGAGGKPTLSLQKPLWMLVCGSRQRHPRCPP